jgi:transcription antitermination factor NusG
MLFCGPRGEALSQLVIPRGNMQNCWFALHTRHQHESKVTQILRNKGFDTFLPMYQTVKRWSDRQKTVSLPLFPGYVFISQMEERKYEVLNTHGVAAIVSVAGTPASISNQEIENIRRAVNTSTNVEPHPFLQIGDVISVRSGPLAGTTGFLVRKKDSFRLVICVEILGRAASVEIDAVDLDFPSAPHMGSELRVS